MNDKNEQIGEDLILRKIASRLAESDLRIEMSAADEEMMKADIIHKITLSGVENHSFVLDKVAEFIKMAALKLKLSNLQIFGIRSRVVGYAMENDNRFSWSRFAYRLRFATASFMLMIFALTSFLVVTSDVNIVRASKWTFIEDVRGSVSVNRDGLIMEVNNDFALKEGDLIVTNDESFVVIRFLDDSVIRLDENSSIKINKLYVSPENSAHTSVNVALQEGQVWTKVVNLVDESDFVVETTEAKAAVKDRASFEIVKDEHEVSLTVFENSVDVTRNVGMVETVQPVVSGFKANISADDEDGTILIVMNDVEVSPNSWAQMNLDLDEVHQDKLKDESEENNEKLLAEESVLNNAIVDFKNSTLGMFQDPELESLRVKFVDAHIGFLKAQQLLQDGKRTEALKYLYTYKNVINEIDQRLPGLNTINLEKARVLRNMVEENLLIQRKNFELVHVDDPLYTAKNMLMDIDFGVDQNIIAQVDNLLNKQKSRLSEVEYLVSHRKIDEARSVFEFYLKEMDTILTMVDLGREGNIQNNVFDLFKVQIAQLKTLHSIERKFRYVEDFEMAQAVRDVINLNIEKLMDILNSHQERKVPFALLQELESLIDSYDYEDKLSDQISKELELKLQSYPEYALISEDNNLMDIDRNVEEPFLEKTSTEEVGARIIDFDVLKED